MADRLELELLAAQLERMRGLLCGYSLSRLDEARLVRALDGAYPGET